MREIRNKLEFMEQLESLLLEIPKQEREEALQYYEDYFADAGEENEQSVLEALGAVQKVAENIKKDLDESRGLEEYEARKVEPGKEMIKYRPEVEPGKEMIKYQPEGEPGKAASKEETKKWGLSGRARGLLIVLGILASPVLFGLLLGLLGIFIGVGAAWLALIVSFGAVALALVVVAMILLVVGIVGIIHSPLTGVGVLGGALLIAAVGILFLMLCALLVWGVSAISGATGKLFRGKKSRKTV